MQKMIVLLACVFISLSSFAKIWRVNNNAGVVADFTQVTTAVSSASVLAGDTIHVEPSATAYNGGSLTKRLVIIGVGYFLDPADVNYFYNAGLQYSTASSTIAFFDIDNAAAAGSKIMGLFFSNRLYVYGNATALNLTIEKCRFGSTGFYFVSGSASTIDGITIRKSFFDNAPFFRSSSTISNLVIENNIFYGSSAYLSMGTNVVGSGNIFRNNSFFNSASASSISNAYVANNIFSFNGQNTFTNCTIKNNLFAAAQTLPGTATGNQVSVNMTNVYVGSVTGSVETRVALKSGSPAIGAGVTIAGYTPDAGAFGGPDPYKLSGIPPVPSIYSLTVPTSIPTGTATMNVTFSSRNNN